MVNVTETTGKTPRQKRDRLSAGAKTAAVTKAKTKGSGRKQAYLSEEMAPKRNKRVDDKGSELINALDQRKIWMETARACREALIDIMQKEKINEYLLEVDTRTFKLELVDETNLKASKLKILPEQD